MYSANQIIRGISLIVAFAFLTLSPQARAVCQEDCLANNNTVLGDDPLLNNTGSDNTAIGFNALYSNTSGYENTATGSYALNRNTYGDWNTATGHEALLGNTTGIVNTATGTGALKFNSTGFYNTATGGFALQVNTAGYGNTATGYNALSLNAHGVQNTANGWEALGSSKGSFNTAIGSHALGDNHGNRNTALGNEAGVFLTGGDDNIDIGNMGVRGDSAIIRIGTTGTQTNTYVAGISEATVPGGVTVIVDSLGHLGTITSSARFKDAIKPMDKASEAILALQPVTFRYKKELDPEAIPQFGLVAEQVAKVDPDLVARDESGKPYTVRYEAVNAMLLNEFLKEHRKVDALEATVAAQQKGFESQVAALTASLKAQAAQLQNVSAQIKAQAPASRVVANE